MTLPKFPPKFSPPESLDSSPPRAHLLRTMPSPLRRVQELITQICATMTIAQSAEFLDDLVEEVASRREAAHEDAERAATKNEG